MFLFKAHHLESDLEEGHSMERLLANTDQVTPHPVVNYPLHRDVGKLSVNLKNTDAGSYHNGELTRPVKAPVHVMLLKDIERHIEDFQEVSLSSR